jgi:hypothetical protein
VVTARLRRLAFLFLPVILVALYLGWTRAQAQAMPSQPPQVYRIYFADQADLNRLAGELDIWQVDHDIGYALAPLSPDQLAVLQSTHQIELLSAASLPWAATFSMQPAGIPNYTCYRTVEETSDRLAQLAVDYPALATLRIIGSSWDKLRAGGPSGYDLEVLVLTNRARTAPKFRFFLMGAVHAREYATAETALRFAESLLTGYGVDADATWLLDYGELHVLPNANPDGRKKAESGLLWRKNTNTNAACSVTSAQSSYGVDLNRNSSFQWNICSGCSSSNTCSQVYRGESPASEPEIQALESYMASIFSSRRGEDLAAAAPVNTPGLMVSLHSYGQYVLFPWGWSSNPAPNAAGLQTLGRKFGYYLGYETCQAGAFGCFYQTDGTNDDWAYGVLGIPAYTFEMGTWFFEDCNHYEANIRDDVLAALHYGFKAARAPYQLPAGPEIVNLAVTSASVTAGQIVTLTATADDTRSDGGSYGRDPAQAIAQVQVLLDQPPWEQGGLSFAATPADGRFDESAEPFSLPIKTACLPAGRHTLFVQAQDATATWGVSSAKFLEIANEPGFAVSPLATSATTYAAEAVDYTFTVTNTGAVTATYQIEPANDIGSGSWEISTSPLDPVAPDTTVTVTLQLTPPVKAAGAVTTIPVLVRSASTPDNCLQILLTTTVIPRLLMPVIWHQP